MRAGQTGEAVSDAARTAPGGTQAHDQAALPEEAPAPAHQHTRLCLCPCPFSLRTPSRCVPTSPGHPPVMPVGGSFPGGKGVSVALQSSQALARWLLDRLEDRAGLPVCWRRMIPQEAACGRCCPRQGFGVGTRSCDLPPLPSGLRAPGMQVRAEVTLCSVMNDQNPSPRSPHMLRPLITRPQSFVDPYAGCCRVQGMDFPARSKCMSAWACQLTRSVLTHCVKALCCPLAFAMHQGPKAAASKGHILILRTK